MNTKIRRAFFIFILNGLFIWNIGASVNTKDSFPRVPGEYIIRLKDNGNIFQLIQEIESNFQGPGIQLDRIIKLSYGDLYIVNYDKRLNQKSIVAIQDHIRKNPRVKYVEPNYIYSLIKPVEEISINHAPDKFIYPMLPNSRVEAPNDPDFPSLWGLHNTGDNLSQSKNHHSLGVPGADISALLAWDITLGSNEVKVAVIDTGVDRNHPDLAANMWANELELNGEAGVDDDGNGFVDDIHGYDFANEDADPMDGNGHGTHCAGTIGAVHDNEEGVAGVMANVKIVALKFLTDSGSGESVSAIRAIDYATELNVDIMSNSWGGGGHSQAMQEAIERARDRGIIFVAAAGNSNSNNDHVAHYPSGYQVENVIAVAAHTADDRLASFSSYGPNSVHIAAPGQKILSTVENGQYSYLSGTSMATPHVSGVLGLLIAKEGRMPHPVMSERLMATGVPQKIYRRKLISGRRVNAYNLLMDIRPVVDEPPEDAWESHLLDEPFETMHPYSNGMDITRIIEVPGAKYIRARILKYDTERKYDYLEIIDKNGKVVEIISGSGEDFETDYVDGDTLTIRFASDYSVTGWGFVIEEVEVIMN